MESLAAFQRNFDGLEKWADRTCVRLKNKCKVLYLGWNISRHREIEPDSVYAEKHFELCKLNVNQECVVVMMKADCILGCVSNCALQVGGGDFIFFFPLPFCDHQIVSGVCCPVFGPPVLRKTLTKRVNQVEGHQDAFGIGMRARRGSEERLDFSILKQKVTMGFYHCLQLLNARL